jgi:hypothetical protein
MITLNRPSFLEATPVRRQDGTRGSLWRDKILKSDTFRRNYFVFRAGVVSFSALSVIARFFYFLPVVGWKMLF